jgi:hypothetical protein
MRAIVATGILAFGISLLVSAQDAAPEFLLNREQVAGLVRAFNEGLAYVPGEVLVKFRPGFEPAQQARALSVVRGGLQSTETRWIGNILHVRAQTEDNAEALADVLSRQPEVEWAQPNYLSRLKAVPNDPSYSRQWNFDLINMPLAWGHQRHPIEQRDGGRD